jgi:hypothetical protein
MVSYINVQHTPAVYKGSVTDHSLLPIIAGHPSKAPQLKASPNNIHNIQLNNKIINKYIVIS